jgi:hypothetical protein
LDTIIEYLPVNDHAAGLKYLGITCGMWLTIYYLTAKNGILNINTVNSTKNSRIMPCFLAIAKDACGYEGKMWEKKSIMFFSKL